MDRSILLTNLFNVATPELGVKVVEAVHPDDYTTRCQALITAAAVGGSASPFVQGFEIAGGGAGDTARVILTLTRNLGWGLYTSIPCALARVLFKTARHAAEITTVLEQMYAEIVAASSSGAPFVWQPRIVGTGRDGTFLIGLLWADGTPGSLMLNVEAFSDSGEVLAPTILASLTIPATPDGTVDTETAWDISWGMLVNDNTGSGAGCRLDMNGAPLWESYELGAAALWQSNFGQYMHIQDNTGPTTFDLLVTNTGGLGVHARGVSLRATICNYPNNPS